MRLSFLLRGDGINFPARAEGLGARLAERWMASSSVGVATVRALASSTSQSRPTARSSQVTATSLHLALLLALCAGFLDAYTFLEKGGVFANAQSANVILFGVEAADGAWSEALRHLPPIAAFVLGVAWAGLLQRRPDRAGMRRPARMALAIEVAILAIVGFIPASAPDVVAVCLLSFAAAMQSVIFATLRGWTYSSILATINLRVMVLAAYAAIVDRDREAMLEATSFAGLVVLFGAGAALGGLLSLHLHSRAIWIAAALLAVNFVFYPLTARQARA